MYCSLSQKAISQVTKNLFTQFMPTFSIAFCLVDGNAGINSIFPDFKTPKGTVTIT